VHNSDQWTEIDESVAHSPVRRPVAQIMVLTLMVLFEQRDAWMVA